MTALQDVRNRVQRALERAKKRDGPLDFRGISVKQITDPDDFSVRFLVTKDSGIIDDELKREFGSVLDIACSETDGLPEDEGVWSDENGFHEYAAIVGLLYF
ncbi:MAG: hypothetical protein ACE5H4_03465 [Candidatus Thorarchaeota archaeon]